MGESYQSFTEVLADMCRSPEMSRWHVDNLMTHIAAAALTVDDYEVDVNDLRDDLKLENKEYVMQELISCLMLTNATQNQTILRRAWMQSQRTNTSRTDTPEAHKGRSRQSLHRQAEAPIELPQDRRSTSKETRLAMTRM
jgi:hypothetical protein